MDLIEQTHTLKVTEQESNIFFWQYRELELFRCAYYKLDGIVKFDELIESFIRITLSII